MELRNEKLNRVLTKIKSIKHIEIIIAILAVALMILIFSGIKTKTDKSSTVTEPKENAVSTEYDTVTMWERKLSEVLSAIDGVGKTQVMITAKSTSEKVTANTVSTNTSSSQGGTGSVTTSTNTTTSPVLVSSGGKNEPYVIKELNPEIQGVIIVAEGADSPTIKLAIMRAVQTVLQVNAACVEIYPMK